MLSATLPANNWSSCITAPAMARTVRGPTLRRSCAPIRIVPSVGTSSPSNSLTRVVLPQPDAPTMATDSPGSIVKLQSLSTHGSPSA